METRQVVAKFSEHQKETWRTRQALDAAFNALHKLRDEFAKAAVQGYLANSWQAKELDETGDSSREQMATVAEASYVMASAMLEAKFR